MGDKMNPGAFNFVPGGNFVPRSDPNAQNQQGANAQQGGYNPYNPYAQQGYYGQPQGGGYGGGFPYGQQQAGYQGYGGYQGGYQGYGNQAQGYGGAQPGVQGSYQPPHLRGAQNQFQQAPQPNRSSVFPAPQSQNQTPPPSQAPIVPSQVSAGPARTVSLNIGGGSSTSSSSTPVVPKSTGPAKTVSLSIGGAKKAESSTTTPEKKEPAKVISLGKPKATTSSSPANSTTVSRSSTPVTAAEKKVEKADEPADWEAEPEPETQSKPASSAPPAAAATPEPSVPAQTASTATPASQPASTPSAPTTTVSTSRANFSRQAAKTDADGIAQETARVADEETLKELYGSEEIDPNVKQHLNIVFIGHVDAGKSTMGGQLLYLCGMVDKRTMEKLEREAKEAGRETWYLSWALDSTPQERAKGKTVEVGRAFFETDARRYTILDAPGHKTYVPSMISGAAQADIAVLVVSARKGEFETGFERGGQTREHAMLVKNNGVNKMVVVVNKMDDPTVGWAKERFEEVSTKITPYLKQVGFNPKTDLTFIPVSAYLGHNMKERVDPKIAPWYTGPSLLEFLDKMPITDRKINAPFMLPISEKYNEMGAMVVGKIESGRIKKGDALLLMPNRASVDVTGIFDEQGEELNAAYCGDNVRLRIRGVGEDEVSPGFVLTSTVRPVKVCSAFVCELAILDAKSIIAAGYSCVLHLHTLSEEITISELLHYFDKKSGRKSKKPPQFAKRGMRIVALIETTAPICIERYADYPMLGRFTLRDEGRTIAIGKVTKLREATDLPNVGDLSLTDAPQVNGA